MELSNLCHSRRNDASAAENHQFSTTNNCCNWNVYMNVNWRSELCVGKAHYMRVACHGQPMWSTLSMWTLWTLLSQSTVGRTATQPDPHLPSHPQPCYAWSMVITWQQVEIMRGESSYPRPVCESREARPTSPEVILQETSLVWRTPIDGRWRS